LQSGRRALENRAGLQAATVAYVQKSEDTDEKLNLFVCVPISGEEMPDTVLVVDDESSIRQICAEALQDAGYEVRLAEAGRTATSMLDNGGVDIVLTDLKMPEMTGLELLARIKENYPSVDVILMTAHATVSTAVEALKLGAYDYIIKPFGIDALINRVNRLAERRELVVENRLMQDHLRTGSGPGGMIGMSPAMQQLYRLILKAAPRKQPVLILGESGTGKELVARAIHSHGLNPNAPFVPVDCGALSASLIESELFGHASGAFTGASQRRVGLLAAAGLGTLFLDEIGELPLEQQAKLLRAIQEREFRALGTNHAERFEARILAATNRDLAAQVKEGKFRGDLYFRLNVLLVQVPPLRERKGDIASLAQYFLEHERGPSDRITGISRHALAQMANYSWPGNVRELRNHIERALMVSDGPLIQSKDLPSELGTSLEASREAPGTLTYLEQIERKAIMDVLETTGGHRQNAAKILGISKTTLYKKLKDYGLEECELAS
jgi:two-component system response regulator HydG